MTITQNTAREIREYPAATHGGTRPGAEISDHTAVGLLPPVWTLWGPVLCIVIAFAVAVVIASGNMNKARALFGQEPISNHWSIKK